MYFVLKFSKGKIVRNFYWLIRNRDNLHIYCRAKKIRYISLYKYDKLIWKGIISFFGKEREREEGREILNSSFVMEVERTSKLYLKAS